MSCSFQSLCEVCWVGERATHKQRCVVGDSRDGAVAAGEAEAGSNVKHEDQLAEGYEAAGDADDKRKDIFCPVSQQHRRRGHERCVAGPLR